MAGSSQIAPSSTTPTGTSCDKAAGTGPSGNLCLTSHERRMRRDFLRVGHLLTLTTTLMQKISTSAILADIAWNPPNRTVWQEWDITDRHGTKWKWVERMSDPLWGLDFDHTHNLVWPSIFKVKFSSSHISGTARSIDQICSVRL